MKVDLPTPGGPEMPRRIDLPVLGSSEVEQLLRLQPVIRAPRFDQRDAARQGAAVAGLYLVGKVLLASLRLHRGPWAARRRCRAPGRRRAACARPLPAGATTWRRRCRPAASSSPWRPRSAMRPSSSTMISSASTTVREAMGDDQRGAVARQLLAGWSGSRARSGCRAPRSPRRTAGSAALSGWCARSRRAASRRRRASGRARRPGSGSRRAAWR